MPAPMVPAPMTAAFCTFIPYLFRKQARFVSRYASIARIRRTLPCGMWSILHVSNLLPSLMRRTPDSDPSLADATPKHLGWLMLTALGIGATIGAGIFV